MGKKVGSRKKRLTKVIEAEIKLKNNSKYLELDCFFYVDTIS